MVRSAAKPRVSNHDAMKAVVRDSAKLAHASRNDSNERISAGLTGFLSSSKP